MRKIIVFLLIGFCIVGQIMAQDQDTTVEPTPTETPAKPAANTPKPEYHISFGPTFGMGAHKVDTTIYWPEPLIGANSYEEKTTTGFGATGLIFTNRVFFDTTPNITVGFISRGRVMVGIFGEIAGEGIYSSRDFSIMTMDIGAGYTYRIKASPRVSLFSDMGINFSYLEYDDWEDTKLDYWGAGIFAGLSCQIDLSQTMFINFGLDAVINIFSSQVGKYKTLGRVISYEDTGRWGDYTSVGFQIMVGWKIDLNQLGN